MTPIDAFASEPPATAERRIVYRSEDLAVNLHVRPLPDGRFMLWGRALGSRGGLAVALLAQGRRQQARAGAQGRFRFLPVVAGPVHLAVEWEGDELELPPVLLGD